MLQTIASEIAMAEVYFAKYRNNLNFNLSFAVRKKNQKQIIEMTFPGKSMIQGSAWSNHP